MMILIIRTILSKSKRLLKIRNEIDKNTSIDQVISNFKPPIFWKDKEVVINQIRKRDVNNINHLIIPTTNAAIQIHVFIVF